MKKRSLFIASLIFTILMGIGSTYQKNVNSSELVASSQEPFDPVSDGLIFVRSYGEGESGERLARSAVKLINFDLTEFSPEYVPENRVASVSAGSYDFIPNKNGTRIRASATVSLNGYVTVTLYLPEQKPSYALAYVFALDPDKPTVENLELAGSFELAITEGEAAVANVVFRQQDFQPVLDDKEINLSFSEEFLYLEDAFLSVAVSDFSAEEVSEVSLEKPLPNYSSETVLYTYINEPISVE